MFDIFILTTCMTPVSERIKEFIESKFGKKGVPIMAKTLGYDSPEKIYRLFREPKDGKKWAEPSIDLLADLTNKFDDLDIKWLLTGENRENREKPQDKKYLEVSDLQKMFVEVMTNLNVIRERVTGLEDVPENLEYIVELLSQKKPQAKAKKA